MLGVLRSGAIDGPEAFAALDAEGIDALAGGNDARRRLLVAARRLPAFDPDGIFESHLRRVPRRVMDAHPLLWKYPSFLATQMLRLVPDAADRAHLLAFVHALAEARIAAQPGRQEARIRANVAVVFAFPVLLGLANTRGERSFRDLLPRTMQRSQMVDAIGRVTGNAYHRLRTKKVTLQQANSKDGMTRILAFFNGAIRHGLFEDSGIARNQPVAASEVRRRLTALEREQPDAIAAREPLRPVVPRERITEGDVQRFLEAVETSACLRERVVLVLLYTTALRAGAIEGMVLADVWDAARNRPLDYWTVTEKFSARRTVKPCAQLTTAMERYVRGRDAVNGEGGCG